MQELAFTLGISAEKIIYIYIVTGITVGLFMHYVFFPLLENHEDLFKKYAPTIISTILLLVALYMQYYAVMLMAIIWAAFIKVVLNSNRYPRINRFVDSIF